MKLNIRGSQGLTFDVEVPEGASVLQLKTEIATVRSLDQTKIRLIYSGKILADNQPLSFYGITEGHAIHMVVSGGKAAPKPAAQPAPAAAPAAPQPSTIPEQPLPQFNQQPQGNPFANMMGGMPGFGGGMPDFSQIQQMMQNPMFQQAMDQMMANPEMLRSMIESNPMFANNPMLRQSMEAMIQNPEILRQSLEMMRGMGGDGSSPFDLNALYQNPEVQRMMNDPQLMQQYMNAMGGGANPFGGLFGQPAAPATTAPPAHSTASSSSSLSDADRATFYKITGMEETPELNNQLNSAKAARAVRQLIEACRNLRRENIQVFPTVQELNAAPAPAAAAPAAPAVSNEERFASQLQQMNEMGLMDNDKNIRALLASNGNVNVAIERIFSGFN